MKLSFTYPFLTMELEIKTTVDAVLEDWHQSRKQRYFLYQDKRIQVNEQTIQQNVALSPCNILRIDVTPFAFDTIEADAQPLHICYEDDLFLIVEKSPHLLVHSDGVNTAHTLSNRVAAYFEATHQHLPVRAIHRLDVETSGLLMFCKIPFFQPLLDHMLATKKIYREYDAFVEGRITSKKQTITLPIGKHRHDARKMYISNHGKTAKTEVFVKKVYHDFTWIHCILHTGRTHQIRVHLSAIQHPLLGDTLYGNARPHMQRLALHASCMQFYHPLKQCSCRVDCPLPKDMALRLK